MASDSATPNRLREYHEGPAGLALAGRYRFRFPTALHSLVSAIGGLVVNSKVDRLTGRVDALERRHLRAMPAHLPAT